MSRKPRSWEFTGASRIVASAWLVGRHCLGAALPALAVGLALSGFSPDGLLADLRTAQDLARLEALLDKALQLVRDTRAQARSEAAEAGLLYYGLAQTAADRVPHPRAERGRLRNQDSARRRADRHPRQEPDPPGRPRPHRGRTRLL